MRQVQGKAEHRSQGVDTYDEREAQALTKKLAKCVGPNINKDGWGGNPHACVDDDHFTYQHTYLFKKADSDSSHCGLIGDKLGKDVFPEFQKQFPNIASNKPACVYTPKVQLLDNWGWCNANSAPAPECYNFGSGVWGCWNDDSNAYAICDKGLRAHISTPWTSFAGQFVKVASLW
ncbi:MAG: hypothetical protein HY981_03080 [Candidatus Magasanikbacteria bacterium]|nr:hypothetical protein [Candidatus Magasanikbacteria bacterium]